MTPDRNLIAELELNDLRFGELVALENTDNTYGRCFRRGAVTIGVVVHSDCIIAGHGPGITTIFTSRERKIAPEIVSEANLTSYLDLK